MLALAAATPHLRVRESAPRGQCAPTEAFKISWGFRSILGVGLGMVYPPAVWMERQTFVGGGVKNVLGGFLPGEYCPSSRVNISMVGVWAL